MTAAGFIDRRSAAWAIWLCFFASGMSGLVYQVVWVRELVLVFGATTFAVSTVLTAFMGGLALGSYYFGRRSLRIRRPLRLYGFIEIGIGLYGLAVPFIFALLPSIYQPFWQRFHLSFFSISIVRFFFAALVLILPTALMGATLPVLANYYARERERIGLRVGSLYSLNTFGAVLGAAATGFVLIPTLGMRAATITAAAINILLGFVALSVSRVEEAGNPAAETDGETRAQDEPKTPEQAVPLDRRKVVIALVAFALSGFIALSYEVIWSRVLALIIGSSVYAFSIMLTTFLIGLAVGASVASRFVDRITRPVFTFALLEVGVGISSFAGAYLFNDLPYIFVQFYRWIDPTAFSVLLLVRFLVAALVIIVPTLLLGALFPLVVKIVASGPRNRTTGQTVGDAYAANTLGSIIGSFASGFILIPWLGLLGSLRVCIALNFVVSAALFFLARSEPAKSRAEAKPKKRASKNSSSKAISIKGDSNKGASSKGRAAFALPARSRLVAAAVSAALIVVVVLFEPPWDSDVMSSAVYRYAPSLAKMNRQEFDQYLKRGQGETVFYKEGITATVVVQQVGANRVLKANGKPEASTTGDMPTQILIGTLPLFVREQTDDVLVIGLGSGITLGSIEQFPVKRVTCVELEPAIVEASHYFNEFNNRPLDDPRLRLISNDGRNFIFTTDEKFDVIVSEPSNPWLTGVANLFTLEYFKRGADRLKDDGVFSQWLQIYEMSPDDLKTLVATFRAAFPYVYVFRGAEGDLMLLGSKSERRLDLAAMSAHFNDPKIGADHKRINTTLPSDLISRLYLGPEEVNRFASNAPLNTDDNALIEFNAPRRVGLDEETVQRNVAALLDEAAAPSRYIKGGGDEAGFLLESALGAIKRNDTARAEQLVNYSLELSQTARARSVLGELRFARNDETGAIEAWQQALAINPAHYYTLINLGKLYLTKQDLARASSYLDKAIAAEPDSARGHHLRGLAYQAGGDAARAAVEYRKTLPDGPYTRSIPTFYLNFGTSLVALGLFEEAVQMLEEYTRLAPADPEGHYQLGAVYERLSSRTLDDILTRRAVAELKRALVAQPEHALAHYHLSRAYRRLEMYDEADIEFTLYERFKGSDLSTAPGPNMPFP